MGELLPIRRVWLLGGALRLAWYLRRLPRSSLPGVTRGMLRLLFLPRVSAVEEAWWAAEKASRFCRRWFGARDTCLVRVLVAGALLRDRHPLHLHIGCRPAKNPGLFPEGHAWLTVGNQVVGGDTPTRVADFQEVLVLPLDREALDQGDRYLQREAPMG